MSGIPRRIRASRIYAGLSREELGEAIERSGDVIREIELGRRNVGRHEMPAIAKACDVPLWFIQHGFDGGATRFVIIRKELRDQLEPGEEVDASDTYPGMAQGLVYHRVGPMVFQDTSEITTSPGTGAGPSDSDLVDEELRSRGADEDERGLG